ncbi:MAG: aminotransferase class V-fold PLP-dependent enzyme [Pirellulales bacterium]
MTIVAILDDEAAFAHFRDLWSLDPRVSYLNHGSFGPPPRSVLAARHAWLDKLSANPMDFYVRQLGGHLQHARGRLAQLVGTSGENLAFVENASTGMNIVADSVSLQPGDEVLTTDHDYGAVMRTWRRVCEAAGANLVVQAVPLPLQSPGQIVTAIMSGVTPRTRLLVFSHVTSPTAIVFPAREICSAARERGLPVCIDGPHAVAMRPLDLDSLNCDFYTASCHKWLSAPFGSGFLYVHPRRQAGLWPSVLSWGRPLGDDVPSWRDEFNWVGTRDPSAYLALPDAIRFLDDAGWETFRGRTHYLASLARQRISALTGLEPLTPDGPEWYGSMVALPLPNPPDGQLPHDWTQPDPLQTALWNDRGMEVPIVWWNNRRMIRVSCHLYTTAAEIDRLVAALADLLPRR